jgi:hypothetical protein
MGVAIGCALFAAWLLAMQHKTRMQTLVRSQPPALDAPR